jgi:hypothetical protein
MSRPGVRVAATALSVMAAAFVLPVLAQQPSAIQPPGTGAVLQGLDKVTARISTFPVSTTEEVRFGTLSIRVRACHKTPPTEPPESTAFLEISDIRVGAEPVLLFSGWMFASSPALSALEHPVYDVWVVDCMKASNSSPDNSG